MEGAWLKSLAYWGEAPPAQEVGLVVCYQFQTCLYHYHLWLDFPW